MEIILCDFTGAHAPKTRMYLCMTMKITSVLLYFAVSILKRYISIVESNIANMFDRHNQYTN